MSTRLWNAVDAHLKKEVGPGVDCLLTRVQARCGLVLVGMLSLFSTGGGGRSTDVAAGLHGAGETLATTSRRQSVHQISGIYQPERVCKGHAS